MPTIETRAGSIKPGETIERLWALARTGDRDALALMRDGARTARAAGSIGASRLMEAIAADPNGVTDEVLLAIEHETLLEVGNNLMRAILDADLATVPEQFRERYATLQRVVASVGDQS